MSNKELRKVSKFMDNDKTFEFVISLLKSVYNNIDIIGVLFSDKPLMRVNSK
jgi:hypothetical protein